MISQYSVSCLTSLYESTMFHWIVSSRVCIWLSIILFLHIASHQNAYCTHARSNHVVLENIMSYHGIRTICYMVLYYIRYYTSFKHGSLHHVTLPKIHYKVKRHTVLCHFKNTVFYHHVSHILSCVLGLHETQHVTNSVLYMNCIFFNAY